MKTAVVIGGGLAGIRAALDLHKRGLNTILLEQKSFLGGRAYSYTKPGAPTLDNGHHVTLGCYENYRQLLQELGSPDPIDFQSTLDIPYVGANEFQVSNPVSLKTGGLPAPLHLAQGVMRLRALSLKDRLFTLGIGLLLLRRKQLAKNDVTVTEWLNSGLQPKAAQDWLWTPITLAALNCHPDRASAKVFAEVLARAFMQTKDDSSVGVFKRHLHDVHGKYAESHLPKVGVNVAFMKTVRKLELNNTGTRVNRIRLRDNSTVEGDLFVSALPHHRIESLFEEPFDKKWPALAKFKRLGGNPIVNVYLQYDDLPHPHDFACLMGTTSQWIFDLKALQGCQKIVSITVSDAKSLLDLTNDEISRQVHDELRALFKHWPETFEKAWVIKERKATMDHTPENEKLRPGPKTPLGNLFLAGDWTDTGLPCTLEGAVLSGKSAVESATSDLNLVNT